MSSNLLTVIGLFLSSGAAMWLAVLEIFGRDKAAAKRRLIVAIQKRLQAQSQSLEWLVETYENIASGYGDDSPYDLDAETEPARQRVSRLKQELSRLDDPEVQIQEILAPVPQQFLALCLLAVGLGLQFLGVFL